jgi:23S rRNA (adenine2503-C2)-methyltransferase
MPRGRNAGSIGYALIRNINDQAWRADLLGELLAGRLVHVNDGGR